MQRKKRRTALKAAFWYLLLSGGSWMFLNSYANSCNRLNGENIVPASIAVFDDSASIEVLDHSMKFCITGIRPESKTYCAAYLLVPDEIRAAAYLISLCGTDS